MPYNTFSLFGASAFLLYVLRTAYYRHYIKRCRRNLKGKVVCITGATGGLGEAIALEAASLGCRLVLVGRSQDKLTAIADRLCLGEDNVAIVQLDFSNLDDISIKADQIFSSFNKLDFVIHNAGIGFRGDASTTSFDIHNDLMIVDYFSHVLLTTALLQHVNKARQRCHFIAISSVQGKLAIPYRSAYAAAKHAMNAYFDSLRAECEAKSDRIKVTVVSPGYIKTQLGNSAIFGGSESIPRDDLSRGMSPEYISRVIVDNAMCWKQRDLIIAPIHHRLAIICRVLFPDLYFYFMKMRASSALHR